MISGMSGKTKAILLFEGIFVIGVLAFLFAMRPTAISPLSGHVISDGDFNFQFENARKIILSKNPEFDNAIEFENDFAIRLSPGTYYWKARNWMRESDVMNFTIANKLSLRLEEVNGTMNIYNLGNMDVKIRVLDGEELFGESNETIILPKHISKINSSEFNSSNGEIIIEGEEYG